MSNRDLSKILLLISVILLLAFNYTNSSEYKHRTAHRHSHLKDEEAHRDEDSVAADLAGKVKVLFWIMTSPKNHDKKVKKILISSLALVSRPATWEPPGAGGATS